MHGTVSGPVDAADRTVLSKLHDGYDMKAHTRADSAQAGLMEDAFVDKYAIAGPPEHCLERLGELRDLGLDKVVVSGPTAGADREASVAAMALLDEAVVPSFSSGHR